jgi:hypothetical protein
MTETLNAPIPEVEPEPTPRRVTYVPLNPVNAQCFEALEGSGQAIEHLEAPLRKCASSAEIPELGQMRRYSGILRPRS